MPNKQLIEESNPIDMFGLGPVDANTDRTGDYINVENYRRGLVVVNLGVGTAGDDFLFTVKSAQDASGTGVADWDVISEYWIKQAATNLLAVGQYTKTTQTTDALITGNATSAEQVVQVVVDLDFSQMDTTNGFTFFSCTLTLAASGGAQYCSVNLIPYSPRYAEDVGPSMIA